jgi:hypothetical protein
MASCLGTGNSVIMLYPDVLPSVVEQMKTIYTYILCDTFNWTKSKYLYEALLTWSFLGQTLISEGCIPPQILQIFTPDV